MLKKENRLTKRKEFAFVYKKGERKSNNVVTVLFVPTKLKNPRIGFSVSKKIGKAYVRNRVKRQLREITRKLLPVLDVKFNYIFVCHEGIEEKSFSELSKNIQNVLTKAGKLLKNEQNSLEATL